MKARPHKSLRFSPSGDKEARVIKFLIVFRSASSMNSQNATHVASASELIVEDAGAACVSVVPFIVDFVVLLELATFSLFDWCFEDFLAMFVQILFVPVYSFVLNSFVLSSFILSPNIQYQVP